MAQQEMPNSSELYQAAVKSTLRTIAGVKPDQFNARTPCSEWNVRGVIDHLTWSTGFQLGIFSSTGGVQANHLSHTPGSFETAAAKLIEFAKTPGALEKEAITPFGPMPGGMFLMIPVFGLAAGILGL